MTDVVKPDTSAERIKAIAETLVGWMTGPDSGQNDGLMDAHNALHALLAERDVARAEVERLGRELNASRYGPKHFGEDFHEKFGADLLAERNAAVIARDDAIRRLADAARDAGRWRGISEGNDVVIKHLSAERDALRAQLAEARATLQIAQDGNAALRWAVALREIQRAAAAALEITPDCEMFATLHRTAASALASDDGPQNEAALREAGHE